MGLAAGQNIPQIPYTFCLKTIFPPLFPFYSVVRVRTSHLEDDDGCDMKTVSTVYNTPRVHSPFLSHGSGLLVPLFSSTLSFYVWFISSNHSKRLLLTG
jgi:hypothetical protein